MTSLTYAEQNRLILEHMRLVEPISALYRGKKGIDFDDICVAGREGLVKAARSWGQKGQFEAWAYRCIENAIFDLIRDWEQLDPKGHEIHYPAEGLDEKIYEWRLYHTPYERWERLAASPEEILSEWEELAHARNALLGAMISLSKRDRAILEARFLREPNQSLPSIARDHKISYARVVFLIDRSLKKLKKIIQNREQNENDATQPAPTYSGG